MRREFRFTSEFHALGLRVGAPPLGALLVRRRSSNEMAAITQKMHARHWPKGTSGNPKGKPVGRKANATLAAEVILDGEDEALTRKAVDLALAGDTFALKLVLDRIIPPRRTRRIELDMGDVAAASGLAHGMTAIIQAMAAGKLAPDEAQAMAGVIDSGGAPMSGVTAIEGKS
jgi:hypothetical protein